MAKEKSAYPMMAVNAWHNLRLQFKKKIPTSITKTYLASILNIGEDSARTNILAPLKILGFIGEDDKANTELIVKFRDDSKYSEFCNEIIEKVYPQELRDAFPDSSSEITQIQNWFMTTGVGESAAKRSAAFYMELLLANHERDVKPTTQNTTSKSNGKTSSKSSSSSPIKRSRQEEKEKSETKEEPQGESLPSIAKNLSSQSGVTLNINIQLSVPETTDEKVYEKFFEALKKHLLT